MHCSIIKSSRPCAFENLSILIDHSSYGTFPSATDKTVSRLTNSVERNETSLQDGHTISPSQPLGLSKTYKTQPYKMHACSHTIRNPTQLSPHARKTSDISERRKEHASIHNKRKSRSRSRSKTQQQPTRTYRPTPSKLSHIGNKALSIHICCIHSEPPWDWEMLFLIWERSRAVSGRATREDS